MKMDQWSEGSAAAGYIPKPKERGPVVLHKQSALGAQVNRGTAVAWTGVKGTGRGIAVGAEFFGRFMIELFGSMGGPLGKVGGVIGKGCYAFAVGIVLLAKGIWWCASMAFKGVALFFGAIGAVLLGTAAVVVALARRIGGATTTTGKFFIMGHHTLKSRTCPKIVITSGDEE